MSTKLSSLMFIFIFLVSCKSDKPKNELEGNWYGFDADSSYYELYISDTLIILHHENMGIAEYSFQKEGDRLITTTPLFFERVWTIEDLNDSVFVISDTLETHYYRKISETIDFFGSIQDSIGFSIFKENFSERIRKQRK